MQKSYQANAPRHRKKWTIEQRKKNELTTASVFWWLQTVKLSNYSKQGAENCVVGKF